MSRKSKADSDSSRAAPKQFVSELKSMEQQVGERIIEALQQDATVAVLSAVVVGVDGGQRIVSAPLDAAMLSEVQTLLRRAEENAGKDVQRVSCVGFHCPGPAIDASRGSDDEESG